MSDLDNLKKDLRSFQKPGKAKILQRFFKTGKGKYGEGDIFLGLMTDETRSVANKYFSLDFNFINQLLTSKIHEERVVAIMILCQRFRKADLAGKKEIYDFYFKNISGVNNWDLVDSSAPEIVGGFLYLTESPKDILYRIAKTNGLW